MRQRSNLFGDHAQFLEINQTVHPGVVAEMNERQILLDNREKWNLKWKPGNKSIIQIDVEISPSRAQKAIMTRSNRISFDLD